MFLFSQRDLSATRIKIKNNIGSQVKLEFSKGRKKSGATEGVISDVYPSIFTVQLFEGIKPSRKVSFSYIDVLTSTVLITLIKTAWFYIKVLYPHFAGFFIF